MEGNDPLVEVMKLRGHSDMMGTLIGGLHFGLITRIRRGEDQWLEAYLFSRDRTIMRFRQAFPRSGSISEIVTACNLAMRRV